MSPKRQTWIQTIGALDREHKFYFWRFSGQDNDTTMLHQKRIEQRRFWWMCMRIWQPATTQHHHFQNTAEGSRLFVIQSYVFTVRVQTSSSTSQDEAVHCPLLRWDIIQLKAYWWRGECGYWSQIWKHWSAEVLAVSFFQCFLLI